MALDDAWFKLSLEFDRHSNSLRNFASRKPLQSATDFSLEDEYLLEGLLSRVWQAWCQFCRSCVIESCIGTTDGLGKTIPPLPNALSETHVSGAAIRAHRKRRPPYWGTPNTILRAEPTWGDVDVLFNVLQALRPINSTKLLASFSADHLSAKSLQLIRNGAAHNNSQSIQDIDSLRAHYIVFPISHPTHAMFWVEPGSKDYLMTHAMSRLVEAGLAAVS